MAKRLPTFSESLIVARSHGANSQAPNLWNGLAADWNLLQGGGSTLYDIANGNDGVLDSGLRDNWLMTEKGWAVDFPVGGGDSIRIPDSQRLRNYDTDFCIAAWLNHAENATDTLYAPSGTNWRFMIGNNGSIRLTINGDTMTSAGSNYTVGEWFHAAVSYELAAKEVTFFINGNSIGTDTTTNAVADTPSVVYLWSFFSGQLSTILHYNRALQPAEIQQLYADPHAMHRRRPVTVSFVDAGGGPSASIAPAAYHQAQMAGAL